MSLSRRLAVVAALAPLALSSLGAYAPDPLPENCRLVSEGAPGVAGDELEVCQVRTYFECPVLRVANGSTLSWSEDEPGSVTTGNGCAAYQSSTYVHPAAPDLHRADFSGTFTGRLDSLDIHVNVSFPGPPSASWQTWVTVKVDGKSVRDGRYESNGTDIDGTQSRIKEYVIPVRSLELTGVDDDGEHVIDVTFLQVSTVHEGLIWMGAAEVDSGIDFNPAPATP